MKKLLSSLVIAILLVGVIAVSSSFAEGKKPKVIHIGCSGGGYGKPFSIYLIGIVHAKGLLEEEFKTDGIKIEWNIFKGAGPAVNEAFANGALDLASYGDFPSVIGRAGGLKTKLVSPSYARTNSYIAVPADSKAETILDLKGKKIGIGKGTATQLVLNRILEGNGLTEKDVKLYNLSGADADSALAAKQIDAEQAGQNVLRLRSLGIAKIIFSTHKAPDRWKVAGALFVTEQFAKEYPEILKRILRVYVKAARWASDEANREEVLKTWAQGGIPYAFFKEDLQGRPISDFITPIIDDYFVNHYKEAAAFSKERGFIRKEFDVEKWIDRSFVDAALKEEGLENYWQPRDADGNPISK